MMIYSRSTCSVSAASSGSQQGFSLIELLVSMLIALIILAGATQSLIDNKNKFLLNDQLAIIQENARFAIQEMSYELRMAGFLGCSKEASVANVVDYDAAASGAIFYQGVGLEGWDSSEASANFPDSYKDDVLANTDSFLVSRVDADNSYTTSEKTTAGSSVVVKINGDHDVKKGAIMVVATPTCNQISIFQNSQQNNNNNASQFTSNTGGSTSPGNCEKAKVFGSGDCNNKAGLNSGENFPTGSTVMQFVANAYYIRASSIDSSIPSLYRESVGVDAGDAAVTAEELLIGVEDMQLLYGIDTDAALDGLANQYVTADQIDGVGVMTWARVASVRLSLLLRSLNPVWSEDQTFEFDGRDYTDRFLRQRVTTTVQLRNLSLVN